MFIIFGTIGQTCKPLVFALLPDKSARSYDIFFEQLSSALKRHKLKLEKAKTFISDFETNIQKYFSKWFPNIETKGCLFHYSKAIWKKVSDHGMKRFYSNKSEDPKFGNFIRLILGLPFLKIEDIN